MRSIDVNLDSPMRLDTGPGTSCGRISLLIATIKTIIIITNLLQQ